MKNIRLFRLKALENRLISIQAPPPSSPSPSLSNLTVSSSSSSDNDNSTSANDINTKKTEWINGEEVPLWMLRYFPDFFSQESQSSSPQYPRSLDGSGSADEPWGKMGVYGYLLTIGMTLVLGAYTAYDYFVNDSSTKTLAALKERRVVEELERLRRVERLSRLSTVSSPQTDSARESSSSSH